MQSTFRAHLALFLVNALYGASHILAKGVMPLFLKPTVFILLRAAGATILFWGVKQLFTREKIDKKDYPRLIACGLFGVAVNQLFFFHGLNLSSSINSGIIMTVNPILVVVLSYFILKERLTGWKLGGVLLGATGAILLTLSGGAGTGDSLLGDVFLLVNALSYAIYLVIAKPLMFKYKPLTVITYVFTFGLAFVLLYPPTIPDLVATDFGAFTPGITAKVIYVIVGVTFLTYLLTMYGLKHLTPSVSSSYIYLQPVMVMFFAVTLSYIGWADDYTDTITLEKIGYMLLIFLGVYMVSKRIPLKT
jgi:drug/metabolite transporter (DMT)-like permease